MKASQFIAVVLPLLAGVELTGSATSEVQADLLVPSVGTGPEPVAAVKRYNGVTGEFVGDFVTGPTMGFPHLGVFGPDGNLYVFDVGLPGNSGVWRYNGKTGSLIGRYIDMTEFNSFDDMTFGPDGHFYAVHMGGIKRFDGKTGALIDEFVPVGRGGLGWAYSLVFGPDGNLYTYDGSDTTVKRYSGTTGEFIDVFVPTSWLGGLVRLGFRCDGKLYALPTGYSNIVQVRRFNGKTGEFIDDFVLDPSLYGIAFTFAPDGDLYIVAYDGEGQKVVARYDGVTGESKGDFVARGSFTPSAPAFVTFMPANGIMTGAGSLGDLPQLPSFEAQLFSFQVLASKGKVRGQLRAILLEIQDRELEVKVFSSTAITSAAFWDDPAIKPGSTSPPTRDTMAFCGKGEVDGNEVTFEARVSDAGEPGALRDHFRLTIWSPGEIGPVDTLGGPIAAGNIQSVAEW